MYTGGKSGKHPPDPNRVHRVIMGNLVDGTLPVNILNRLVARGAARWGGPYLFFLCGCLAGPRVPGTMPRPVPPGLKAAHLFVWRDMSVGPQSDEAPEVHEDNDTCKTS